MSIEDAKPEWAEIVLKAQDVLGFIEMEFEEIFGVQKVQVGDDFVGRPNCDEFGFDTYDGSIEIMLRSLAIIPPDFLERMAQMGFTYGWVNWADGTESHFHSSGITERKQVSHPRWNEERSRESWSGSNKIVIAPRKS